MQTDYSAQAKGRPGLTQFKIYNTTLVNKESSAAIPWGRMVQYDAGTGGAKMLTATGQKLAGVLVHEHDYDRTTGLDSTLDGPVPGQPMAIAFMGCIQVQVEEAVVAFDRAFVRHTANGGLDRIGGFRKSANTGCDDIGNVAVFITSSAIDKTAWLFINLTHQPLGGVGTSDLAPGVLSADADGRALMATDYFNAATVLLKFADGSFAADTATRALFGDAIWTAAKLAVAVQVAMLGTPTFTLGVEDGGDGRLLTVQLKDVAGNNVAKRTLVTLWLSDTDVDAVGTALTSLVVTTGTLVKADTASLILRVLSDVNGVVALTGTIAGAATRYLNAAAATVHARSTAIVWAA